MKHELIYYTKRSVKTKLETIFAVFDYIIKHGECVIECHKLNPETNKYNYSDEKTFKNVSVNGKKVTIETEKDGHGDIMEIDLNHELDFYL